MNQRLLISLLLLLCCNSWAESSANITAFLKAEAAAALAANDFARASEITALLAGQGAPKKAKDSDADETDTTQQPAPEQPAADTAPPSSNGSDSGQLISTVISAAPTSNNRACHKTDPATAAAIQTTGKELANATTAGDVTKIKQLSSALNALVKETVPLNGSWGDACKEGEAPEDFFLGLYLGAEGTSIEGLKEKATPRIGILAYNQLARFRPSDNIRWPFHRDCRAGGETLCGFGFGIHGWLSTLVTNTAEQSMTEADASSAMSTPAMMPASTPSKTEVEIDNALESELGMFIPVVQKQWDKRGSLLIGPTGFASITKADDSDDFNHRRYGGIRFAYSPEFYLDLLYGKTEGLKGKRFEARYQMPVGKITENSRLHLGLVANTGTRGSGEGDSIRLFATWNTDILSILGKK